MGNHAENRVTRLTPPGMAAVATVRLSGSGVSEFVKQHLSQSPQVGRCRHVELLDQDELVDDPLAVLINPNLLDLSLHGSTWIVQKTIDLAIRMGFRSVSHDEIISEISDEIEAEVIRDLPKALTEQAIQILLAQPDAWREMFAKNDSAKKAQALADRSLGYLLNPPTVAIVGVPNAGKSTLANQLFGRNHSITADLPGTTRDWVGEKANIEGLVVTLIDTPGLRTTSDFLESAAIKQSHAMVNSADLIIELYDASQPRELQPVRFERSLRVMNKIDMTQQWFDNSMHGVCASSGLGIATLKHLILESFDCQNLRSLHARIWTSRQRNLLIR